MVSQLSPLLLTGVCVHCFRDKHFCFKSQQCLKNSAPLYFASKSCICNRIRSVSVSVKAGNFCFQHNHNTSQSWGRKSITWLSEHYCTKNTHLYSTSNMNSCTNNNSTEFNKTGCKLTNPSPMATLFHDSFPQWSFLRGSTVIDFQCPVSHQGNISWEPITNMWPITKQKVQPIFTTKRAMTFLFIFNYLIKVCRLFFLYKK